MITLYITAWPCPLPCHMVAWPGMQLTAMRVDRLILLDRIEEADEKARNWYYEVALPRLAAHGTVETLYDYYDGG